METSGKYKALLVGDNKGFLNLIRFELQDIVSLPIEQIDEAYSGVQALAMADNKNYDLIFMDTDLPILNGFDAIKQIKMQYPSIRIIALSFYNNSQHVHAMLCAGVFEFLLKDDLDGIGLMKISLT